MEKGSSAYDLKQNTSSDSMDASKTFTDVTGDKKGSRMNSGAYRAIQSNQIQPKSFTTHWMVLLAADG